MTERGSALASVLGYNPADQLQRISHRGSAKLYRSFQIKPQRADRSPRNIIAPCEDLKAIQRALYKKILVHVEPHPAATAYYHGRSIALNARQHLGCRYLYKTDVSDFFPSITEDRIRLTLNEHFPHLSQSAIAEIVGLTTYEGALPQGAPTSPHLANLALFHFDDHVSKLCHRIDARYTRYADDIAVSAKDMDALIIIDGVIRSSLAELGLSRHGGKTHFIGPSVRKTVTGLDVSGDYVRPPRKYRKKVAALIRMCEKYPSRATMSNLSRIMGYLLHWQGVAPGDLELQELKRRLVPAGTCQLPSWDRSSCGADFLLKLWPSSFGTE